MTDAANQSLQDQLLSKQYRVTPEAFWEVVRGRGDDGYDTMEPAARKGWEAIPAWGLSGWDLGSWPYVVIYHRDTADTWQLAEYCEGDLTVYSYPTRELRDVATDCIAFWHWKHNEESWIDGIESVELAPDRLRGPFSWRRLDAAKAAGEDDG
jgi:hypothetical protein